MAQPAGAVQIGGAKFHAPSAMPHAPPHTPPANAPLETPIRVVRGVSLLLDSDLASAFDWDSGNRDKRTGHGLSLDEIEFALRRRETDQLVRPISARYRHQNEVRHYEAQSQFAPQSADDAV